MVTFAQQLVKLYVESFLLLIMNLSEVMSLIINQLSAGNYTQNIGFYTLLVLLAWVWVQQLKQKEADYHIN
ncbi:hypothetical protein JN11_04861 [Mucilaginibacter frigoritolerans]|uniref:Uncharacterized protein n=1 Tax=Mucilaginibacter frigoritolerans TaxID=652788 RepID=A0A562TL82_9SPHI|nr:hypothetical protein JN11_04861 [Mucilaginibacter frigoritolerans]